MEYLASITGPVELSRDLNDACTKKIEGILTYVKWRNKTEKNNYPSIFPAEPHVELE